MSRGSRILQVAVVLLGLLVLPGCGCGRPDKHAVAMPPPGASPEQVVRAYFDAITGQDKETARALLVPEAADELEFSSPDSPFQNWISVTDLRTEGPRKDKFCAKGDTCARIYVSFNLRQCKPMTQPDGSWSESFGLKMVGDRWLIKGHGQG
jgi:hypothetical protein